MSRGSLLLAFCVLALAPAAHAQSPDWGNLQFPASMSATQNGASPYVFGRVFEPGVTDAPGQGAGIAAQVGYGPDGSDPATSPAWQWSAAAFNIDAGNSDEYLGTVTVPTPGTYDYAYRYSLNGGAWLYADLDGTDNGYSAAQAGNLTVNPGMPSNINWANLQFPPTMSAAEYNQSDFVYGQVWKPGVTDFPGQGPGIVAQVGYGPDGTDPAVAAGWVWSAAAYNVDVGNNDEFHAAFTTPALGVYDYAFRYSYNSGPWLYADLDGTDNGYSASQAGQLTVSIAPTNINWGNLQFPSSIVVQAGAATPSIYGRVWKPGVTDGVGQGAGIVAQIGYGPNGTDPSVWQWTPASYNTDNGNNDEYVATLTVNVGGAYDYAYRYSYNSGPWLYGDLDGGDNGYQSAQAGDLTVTGTTGVGNGAPAALGLRVERNPFRDAALLRLSLPRHERVEVAVFDLGGRRLRTLLSGVQPAGERVVTWDGHDASGASMAQGVYVARVIAGTERRTIKLVRTE